MRQYVAVAFVSLLALGGASSADDRDLLRDSVGEPYVFILLDTSGSMHWTPTCTAEQLANGQCSLLCPTGDCYAPLQSDDPSSKFFQAKSALYEVLRDIDDIHFGFATYNQDGLHLRSKHWLYRAASDGPDIPGWGPFPAQGAQEVFGRAWSCDNGNGDEEAGCSASSPADLGDAWELARVQRLAKGGLGFATNVTFFVRSGSTWRVRYEPRSGSYGAGLTVRVLVERCLNSSCGNRETTGDLDVDFEPLGEFATWDAGADRAERQRGFFDQGEAADPLTGNTCAGWDPNDDVPSDRHGGYSARWPTDSSDPRGSAFSVGDVIPLDWQADHKTDILRRLAPNLALDPTADPDFRTAVYFRDARNGGEDFLRLKNEAARPFVASGSTPLGNSVDAFRIWWAGCPQGTCPRSTGWKDVAAASDPDWGCRRKFLLILTDGDDTCPGPDACSSTASLFAQEGVKTYVVAFGVENRPGNRLTCMAANGGSGKPIYPQSKAELVKALEDIFGQIREEASAFASAAVPSVQAEVADRIYLSSFTPLNSESVWDGHLDAYLKPLPLTVDGKPDRNRACPPPGSPNRSSCHLWDAGEALLDQAPDASDLATTVDESTLRLGLQPDQRRVFHAKAGFLIPRTLRLFSPPPSDPNTDPATDPEWVDLWNGLGIGFTDRAAAAARARNIIARTLEIKESTVELIGGGTRPVRYVLGDIFHSDPAVVDRPNDFGFFSANLESQGEPCSTDPGYRCFAQEHARRRKMLVVGSNDGQLHFFDAGVWDPSRARFGDGTGAELFSFIPRPALPIVRELAEGSKQIFGVDATPRLDDVFLDPRHNGTPDPDQREWRTLLVGGFREGGSKDGGSRMIDFVSGYYALDITQPDQLEANGDPVDRRVVPSCLATDNQPVAGCGPLPFPALLWEFTDSLAGSQLDEDDNNYPDLGQTWSAPTIGRIRVREGTKTVAKFVAIFGGGMDAESKASPRRGNWLYMVDMETGKAIYKRRLAGSAPADPAALDVDLDGFLDVLYLGTTAGLMYKVDLRSVPDLETTTLRRDLAVPELVMDQEVTRVLDPRWEPFPIFSTLGRPIYFAPTLFYVSRAQRFALAFGTGDREDLWSFNGQEGRFYVLLDDNFTADLLATGDLPKDETLYPAIRPDALNAPAGTDFVLAPATGQERGWFLRLDPDERVITQAFGLSGVVIFSGFQPQVVVDDPAPGGGNQKDGPVCARGGTSRIFVVLASNGNSLLSTGGVPTRFRTVPEFVTNPYVEQGSTKNPDGSGGTGPNSEILDQTQKQILAELKKFYPAGTKFANYWISVSGIRSDTGYVRYATIPVGIIERNWKEH